MTTGKKFFDEDDVISVQCLMSVRVGVFQRQRGQTLPYKEEITALFDFWRDFFVSLFVPSAFTHN